MLPIDLESIGFLGDFCSTEIALEGLKGCEVTELFKLFHKSASSLLNSNRPEANGSEIESTHKLFELIHSDKDANSDDKRNCVNFVWNLLLRKNEINYFVTKKSDASSATGTGGKEGKKDASKNKNASKTQKKSTTTKLINEPNNRGMCEDYSERHCVNDTVRDNLMSYDKCIEKYGASLILVADQNTRNQVMCPSHRHIDFDNLNIMEYCILEAIARTRHEGMFSTGDDGLAQIFDITPKQLHYILVILQSCQLIKRHLISSERKRSVVYLARFAYKHSSQIETICEYLLQKYKKTGSTSGDSFLNIKRNLSFTSRQFKTVVQNGEKSNLLKRYMRSYEHKFKKSKNSDRFHTKTRQIRMVRLTDAYIQNNATSSKGSATCANVDESDDDELDEDEPGRSASLCSYLGTAQSNLYPLYSQIFAKIEENGREGISLKQLGSLFGLDFYRSRRMGTHLQAHPEIVTKIKETNRGKAKFQTIVMRKFLELKREKSDTNLSLQQSQSSSQTSLVAGEPSLTNIVDSPTNGESEEILILKRNDGNKNNSIQALMSNRTLNRKKLIMDHLEKHKIATKYEITKEIRTYESEQGLKGCIDAKTTKRMLLNLESEHKLHVFEVLLKNVSYMCVRLYGISETDEIYVNYCATFKRTFDSVDLKLNTTDGTNVSDKADDKNSNGASGDASQTKLYPQQQQQPSFKLTRSFINSVVSKLKFTTNYSKIYALVPKFQKCIILHRLLTYILFFYDGQQQTGSVPFEEIKVYPSDSTDKELVNNYSLPTLEHTYQSSITWKTFIPPLPRSNLRLGTSSSINNNCIFIGEIFSHMPLSVFCSIIVINHHVPGLVALLKHPQKRHLLVKDLPPKIIAPLIYQRRYLQRMLGILQILAALGLITFVESPCKTNQAINRDVQSQMIYVHKRAAFYDTTSSRQTDWEEFIAASKAQFASADVALERCVFEFGSAESVVDYWHKLLHVSMNTYKFSAGRYIHENKRLRRELMNKVACRFSLESISDLWSIQRLSDQLGPGGYDSQLFLNRFKNWMIPSNVANWSGLSKGSNESASTKDADLTFAPVSELALIFPFGVFRGIASSSSGNFETKSAARRSKAAQKRKLDEQAAKLNENSSKKFKKAHNAREFKIIKARQLVDRAKLSTVRSSQLTRHQQQKQQLQQQLQRKQNQAQDDKRATWTPAEDEMILLIKVTSLYFFPRERSVPFKLICDVMHELMPVMCADKKISSFGRRMKVLLKSKARILYVTNKLELCRQDKETTVKYASQRVSLKRSTAEKSQTDLFVRFIRDFQERLLKSKKFSSSNDANDAKVYDDECEPGELKIDLPQTMDEFNRKYRILNSQRDVLFKNKHSYYAQPTSDYEIACNTVHSAIHSSILINDKNPRTYELSKLLGNYGDQLTDVIYRMSRQHQIIAPTKCSELKKKNVTAFSKYIGKPYHISQRYQYKWSNAMSSNLLNETDKFKHQLVDFKHKQLEAGAAHDEEMFECTDKDDLGMTSFLAHTIDNANLQVQIDVPNKIWVSNYI